MRTVAKTILRRFGVFEPVRRLVWRRRLHQSARKIDLRDIDAPGERSARCVRFNSLEQYQSEWKKNSALWVARRTLERELCTSSGGLLLRGKDPLTGRSEIFYQGPHEEASPVYLNLRESLTCQRYGLASRQRVTLVSLHALIPKATLKGKVIYLSEQTTRFFHFFRKHYPVIGSEYLGSGMKPGTIENGVRHEDITHLSFSRESIDVFITLEVLEHVPDYRSGLAEMARVLRPGGLALITVPFNPLEEDHLERARIEPTGEITHLLPPEYHGDPINAQGGILCFRQYGWRLLQELRDAGFRKTSLLETWDLDAAMLGDCLLVICAQK